MPYADFLVNMSASADVLAQAKVEIDLAAIPEGKNVRTYLSGATIHLQDLHGAPSFNNASIPRTWLN